MAFIQDLTADVAQVMEQGTQVIVMMDGNFSMRDSLLASALSSINLQEAILHRDGRSGPETYHRNANWTPIDGIWTSALVQILQGGYTDYDQITLSDHRCLWIDIAFTCAFGHNMSLIQHPATRRLHCKDPRMVQNNIRIYECLATQKNLLRRVQVLASKATYPLSNELRKEYETLDAIRCDITKYAEKHCRKLKKGQVSFSPEVQQAGKIITALTLVRKKSSGMILVSKLISKPWQAQS
jgi:hypothetical protein